MRGLITKTLMTVLAGAAMACAVDSQAQAGGPVATVRRVSILKGSTFELEINTSRPVVPQTQVVAGPDRLVIDFPQSTPGPGFKPIDVNGGEVKRIRMGLYASNPPVTRVVLDLKGPLPYQIFPSGNNVLVKVLTSGKQSAPAIAAAITPVAAPSAPGIVPVNQPAAPAEPPKPVPHIDIQYAAGKLSIRAEHAMLSDVLYEVQRRTGASVSIPAGAEREPVMANIGPEPAREALTALLDGSPYNFIVVGSDQDPSVLRSILLTPRGSAIPDMPANYAPAPQPVAPEPQVVEGPPPANMDQPQQDTPPPPPDQVPPPPQ